MKSQTRLKTLLILSFLGAFMVGCHKSPEAKANKIVNRVSKKLELNEVQMEKLNTVKDGFLSLVPKEGDNKKEALFKDIEKMILSEKIDRSDAEKMRERRDQLHREMFEKLFPLVQDFHSSLTAEQKQEMVDIIKKRFAKRLKHKF